LKRRNKNEDRDINADIADTNYGELYRERTVRGGVKIMKRKGEITEEWAKQE